MYILLPPSECLLSDLSQTSQRDDVHTFQSGAQKVGRLHRLALQRNKWKIREIDWKICHSVDTKIIKGRQEDEM